MITVVGDYNPRNPTHVATTDALANLDGLPKFTWLDTDQIRARWREIERASGLFVAPASPYRDMEAVLDSIRYARERAVPLVGT